MRKRKLLIGGLASALVIGAASLAYANTITQKADGTLVTSPGGKTKFPKTSYVNAKIHVRTETSDGANTPPSANHAVIDFDKDIKFNVGATPKCALSSISGKSTAVARSACASSLVGTGSAALLLGTPGSPPATTVPVTVSAFNGQPSGGKPTLYLHSDPGFTPVDLIGKLVPSTGGSKFGTALDVIVPPTGGSLKFFDTTVFKKNYVQGRCKQPDHKFDFHGSFTFDSTGPTYPTTAQASSSSKCTVKKHKKHRHHRH